MDRQSQCRLAERRTAGFTMIEVAVVLALIAVGLAAYVQSLVMSSRTAEHTRLHSLAARGAQAQIEELKGFDFATVFAEYNADGADDPGGAGTGAGADFDIEGLDPLNGDADGMVGEIEFPVAGVLATVLREDLVDADFGTPRDLNRDGVVDALDHAGDYELLPVLVRVTWRSPSGGPSTLVFKTMLSDF